MSYTRQYSEVVSGTASKYVTVSYPASQNGGSTSVNVDMRVDIPVDISIHVDTRSFDRSVEHCGTNVNLLTAAVVATEAAEIESKRKNSKKIADTIIGGFFSYVRSEISQQMAELSQNVNAHLMNLKELAQSCYAKKKQMEVDYHRISNRYIKIFDDLNNELSNRIFELDKPAFIFKKETDNQKIRTSDNDLVNIVTIFGTESGDLQSKISASMAKKRAFDTLIKAKLFLWQQKCLNTTVQKSMLNESLSCSMFAPVCFIETNNCKNEINKRVFSTEYLSMLNTNKQQNEIIEQFSSSSITWGKIPIATQNNISLYFNTELNNNLFANDQHSVRVREMIQKIADISLINTMNFQQN